MAKTKRLWSEEVKYKSVVLEIGMLRSMWRGLEIPPLGSVPVPAPTNYKKTLKIIRS